MLFWFVFIFTAFGIQALTILGKLRDSGVRSNLFKSVCGEVVYALCELYITTGLFDRVYVLVKEFDQVIDATLGAEHPNHYFQLVIKGKVLKYQGMYFVFGFCAPLKCLKS